MHWTGKVPGQGQALPLHLNSYFLKNMIMPAWKLGTSQFRQSRGDKIDETNAKD
jgi:hypothetical protein